jgi:hypothetical protein
MGAASSHPELDDESPSSQNIEGLLLKESETVKAWNERYSVLVNRTLSYWDSEQEKRSGAIPRGVISMANCRVCSYFDTEHPEGTILIETPTSDRKRLAAQRGQSRIFIRCPSADLSPQWLRCLQIASREPWRADEAHNKCARQGCDRVFDGMLERRHHCRRCGQVFCAACVPHLQTMKDFYYNAPVRVCMMCYGLQGPLLPEEERRLATEAAGAAQEEHHRESRIADVKRSKQSAAAEAEARRQRLKQQYNVKA